MPTIREVLIDFGFKYTTHPFWENSKRNKQSLTEAESEIRKAILEELKILDKENWNFVNSLNPDTEEYCKAYKEANIKSRCLAQIKSKIGGEK